MAILHAHRAQHVFGLQRIERQRIGFQREQVNDRHTIQAQVLFGKAEVMLPAFRQHHVDFKPRDLSRKDHALQPAQPRKHEFLAKGEVLQQQLVTAETAVPLRPQPVIITKPQCGEIPVHRPSVHVARHAQPQTRSIHGKSFMHSAGQRCVSIEIERDLAEIDTAPVSKMATTEAQADDRAPVRISRQAGMLQRQWLKGYLFSCGVATTRAFFTDRPRIDLETSGNTHRFFHLTPDRSELHHRHRGNSAQVMRP
ncbi:Uncharacterised protein [Enterobacter cloacae]|nr:Uncharacterised protein [Enterobacter cloacae]